ncbi:hypothetical protein AB0F93_00155 [Micromonospora tulbaghiae]|uniref:hypothetical protein n=1 Tax=Micromonospora tulbaghiae TaxID=479978 RepID=UPI00332A1C8F
MTAPVQTPPPQQQLSAAQIAALLALVQAQAELRRQLTQAAVAAALAPLAGFTAWWDAEAVTDLIGRILRVVQPMQRQAAQLTDGYLTNAALVITGQRPRPAGAVDVTRLRRKMTEELADELLAGVRQSVKVELDRIGDEPSTEVQPSPAWGLEHDREYQDPAEAYARVADGYRYATTVLGDSPEKAQKKAEIRLATIAETDVTLAVREQYRRNLSAQNATGYRRILHPELSETGPCGLCVVAADRVYKKEDLLPLHNRCVCEVLPVYGRVDPGITLNGDDLRRIYDAAGGNTREDLRRVRVLMAEHGEIGPILVHGDQHYRSPEEVARTYASSRQVREQAILDALEPRYEETKYRVARGDNLSKTLRWQRARIEELRRSIGAAV